MSKQEKLWNRLLTKPTDFTYTELVKLLNGLHYVEVKKGKTAGSRRAFINTNTQHIIRLHKPHKSNVLKRYQIRQLIDALTNVNRE